MLIRVLYKNNTFDFVKPRLLDELLDSGRISMFKRRRGWVFVGIDPIRMKNDPARPVRDRRRSFEES